MRDCSSDLRSLLQHVIGNCIQQLQSSSASSKSPEELQLPGLQIVPPADCCAHCAQYSNSAKKFSTPTPADGAEEPGEQSERVQLETLSVISEATPGAPGTLETLETGDTFTQQLSSCNYHHHVQTMRSVSKLNNNEHVVMGNVHKLFFIKSILIIV